MEGSVADDLDVGAILEGIFMHIAPLRDAHFGEAGAIRESIVPNLLYPQGEFQAREFLAILERLDFYFRSPFWDYPHAILYFVFCHDTVL